MRFQLSKHKEHKEVDVLEVYDTKGRLLATVQPGDILHGPNLVVASNFMGKVGFVGGAEASVIIRFVDPDNPEPKPEPEKKA